MIAKDLPLAVQRNGTYWLRPNAESEDFSVIIKRADLHATVRHLYPGIVAAIVGAATIRKLEVALGTLPVLTYHPSTVGTQVWRACFDLETCTLYDVEPQYRAARRLADDFVQALLQSVEAEFSRGLTAGQFRLLERWGDTPGHEDLYVRTMYLEVKHLREAVQ